MDQSRVIQVTGGNDQGWELYLYQSLKGWTWRRRRVRMLYGTMKKVRRSGARDTLKLNFEPPPQRMPQQ